MFVLCFNISKSTQNHQQLDVVGQGRREHFLFIFIVRLIIIVRKHIMIKSRDNRLHQFLAYIVAFVQSSSTKYQCCGSGSGIRCPFDPLDPGSGMGKKSRSESGIIILDHISESLETFSWVKFLNSLLRIRIRDPESFWPWFRDPGLKIRILDPG